MLENKIKHLQTLGNRLGDKHNETLNAVREKVVRNNKWFIPSFVDFAIESIVENYLQAEKLEQWLAAYPIQKADTSKTLGLILAGNIPLVGLHDILCCFALNLPTKIKLSSKDSVLMKYVIETLQKLDASWQVEIVERLQGFDKVIATGSNNTNRYFEYYFKQVPALLRTNRNSLAVLNGTETKEELEALADDVFMFFGQGCRNVSKLFLPKGYDVTSLFPVFEKYAFLHHEKLYMDNYDYNRTILLMNQTAHFANEFIMLKEDDALPSRLATLHYSFYETEDEIVQFINANENQLQCVVSKPNTLWKSYSFGQAQKPSLTDYADNEDTMQFLLKN